MRYITFICIYRTNINTQSFSFSFLFIIVITRCGNSTKEILSNCRNFKRCMWILGKFCVSSSVKQCQNVLQDLLFPCITWFKRNFFEYFSTINLINLFHKHVGNKYFPITSRDYFVCIRLGIRMKKKKVYIYIYMEISWYLSNLVPPIVNKEILHEWRENTS